MASAAVLVVPGGIPMTLLLVLSALATAFLLVTAGVEWTVRRLREDPPGYRDTSRGSRD